PPPTSAAPRPRPPAPPTRRDCNQAEGDRPSLPASRDVAPIAAAAASRCASYAGEAARNPRAVTAGSRCAELRAWGGAEPANDSRRELRRGEPSCSEAPEGLPHDP